MVKLRLSCRPSFSILTIRALSTTTVDPRLPVTSKLRNHAVPPDQEVPRLEEVGYFGMFEGGIRVWEPRFNRQPM
jgi:hypothetical protein